VRCLEARQNALGVAKEQLPRLGQRDRPRPSGALDQAHVHDPLQRRDLLADRRLRVAELGGSAAERALVGHGLECREMP
jgi:hypothetical protein